MLCATCNMFETTCCIREICSLTRSYLTLVASLTRSCTLLSHDCQAQLHNYLLTSAFLACGLNKYSSASLNFSFRRDPTSYKTDSIPVNLMGLLPLYLSASGQEKLDQLVLGQNWMTYNKNHEAFERTSALFNKCRGGCSHHECEQGR